MSPTKLEQAQDAREPSEQDFLDLGWNRIEHENPTGNLRIVAQLLAMIGQVLVQLREKMEGDA